MERDRLIIMAAMFAAAILFGGVGLLTRSCGKPVPAVPTEAAPSASAVPSTSSPPPNPHPLRNIHIIEGTAPDSMGVLHDELRHVTCWFEATCPGETSHGCSSAMACLAD